MRNEVASWSAVADKYDTSVISPFAPQVSFPLRGDMRRLLGKWKRRGVLKRRIAFDFGCGRGDGLGLLADQVGFACGLDFSPRMLDLSERFLRARGMAPSRYADRGGLKRLSHDLREFAVGKQGGTKTVLVEADMRNLAPLTNSADLALAINSISPAHAGDASGVFGQVVAALKRGGTLMAVLPSLDAFHYLMALASRLGVDLPDVGHVDAQGMFHENGEQQKFFTPGEITQLCEASRLHVLALKKVRYPWDLMRRFGWGHFAGRPRLWDWYLVARAR